MSANYFDHLEAELRAAVPRATRDRHRLWDRRRRWRSSAGGLALAISVAVTVMVVVLSGALFGHRHVPSRPTLQHHPVAGPGGSEYPLGAVPTLSQLMGNFAVLRRPQTARDRTYRPECGCGRAARQLNNLTRYATTLPSGFRVYLDVEQFIAGGQLNLPAGSYVLNLVVVGPHRVGPHRQLPTSGVAFAPGNYTVFPVPSTPPDSTAKAGVWASIVPDGVATVQWTSGCRRPAGSGCPPVRARTFTVPVLNNVAARQIAHAHGPWQVIWRSADGHTVASFTETTNLAAPPFVVGGRGYRLLRVLEPTGIAGARLGQSAPAATQAIERQLGPPADTTVRAGGCGIDHESVWTSPAVADPLTIFERQGRFVGYQYGAPVWEIGLLRGPGAVLATRRGLTLADTIAVAKRLYHSNLATSTADGGAWRATADGGTLRGSVLPIRYPLRTVTAQNPVATIDAGLTGCATKRN